MHIPEYGFCVVNLDDGMYPAFIAPIHNVALMRDSYLYHARHLSMVCITGFTDLQSGHIAADFPGRSNTQCRQFRRYRSNRLGRPLICLPSYSGRVPIVVYERDAYPRTADS